MTKITLAAHLRLRLTKEYGNYKNACNFYKISYESLKKSIARNIFSEHIINVFFPGVSLDNLQEKYDFQVARIYRPKFGEDIVKRKKLSHLLNIIDEEDLCLIEENKLVAEKIAEVIRSTCAQIREVLR